MLLIFLFRSLRGFYELTISALPATKPDDRLAGNAGAVVSIKSLGDLRVVSSEIGVTDADLPGRLSPVSHPAKHRGLLEADHHQRVLLKFFLEDAADGERITAHQTFVSMTNMDTKEEIIFVAEQVRDCIPDPVWCCNVFRSQDKLTSGYKFDLDVGVKATEFNYVSGRYSIRLIVGDAVISNPVDWHVADIKLQFQPNPADPAEAKASTDR